MSIVKKKEWCPAALAFSHIPSSKTILKTKRASRYKPDLEQIERTISTQLYIRQEQKEQHSKQCVCEGGQGGRKPPQQNENKQEQSPYKQNEVIHFLFCELLLWNLKFCRSVSILWPSISGRFT